MSQSLLVPSEITRIPLAVAHTNIKFAKAIDRSYGTIFGKDGVSMSGKVGPVITIRKPNRYTIRRGSAMNVQAITEDSTTLSVGTEIGIDTQFSDLETTLLVDEYEKRYAEPMGKTISSTMDSDGTALYTGINQAVVFDTTTNTAQATAQTILQAKQKLSEANIPVDDDLSIIVPPVAESKLASQYVNTYNPQSTIAAMFKEGVMSNAHGMNWYMDQTMPSFTTGSRVATVGSTQVYNTGAHVIATGATSAYLFASTGTVAVGDVFQINNVHSVNPETRASTGALQQFVVTAAATLTGTPGVSVSFFPAMNLTGPYQNIDALPANSANVTWIGAASTSYAQCILLHKTAIALASVELDVWKGMDMVSRASFDGMSLRYMRGGDITNGRKLARMDSLYGWALIRPEWAVRGYVALP